MNLRLPREHGTWGMFFVPFAVGWLASGGGGWPVLLLLGASSAVFLSRESLLFWWRARRHAAGPQGTGHALLACAVAAFLLGLPLLIAWKLYALIPLGLAGVGGLVATTELSIRRQGRSVATEFLGIASSSLNAASAHYAGTSRWAADAVWLWALCTFYFASSIFYVKLRVQDAHGKRPELIARARQRCAAYHAVLLAALLALVITRSLPLFALIAFIPVLSRAFAQVFRPSPTLNLKRIGWLEVTFSVVFLLVVGLGFAAQG